jgi:hypothetical protein
MDCDPNKARLLSETRNRKRRRWLLVALWTVGVFATLYVGYIAFELATLIRNDKKAEQMWMILGRRIRARDPQFKDVFQNLLPWSNGLNQPATATERAWNRHYPAVVGKVRSEAELSALRDLISDVCNEYQYDPELVVFLVQIER